MMATICPQTTENTLLYLVQAIHSYTTYIFGKVDTELQACVCIYWLHLHAA